MHEQTTEHPTSRSLSRWLQGVRIQLGAYAGLVLVGLVSGLRYRIVEGTIDERIANATLGMFAILLLGSITFSLAAIVMCRDINLVTKLLAIISSCALFFLCFVVFYVVAIYLFVPQGLIMD